MIVAAAKMTLRQKKLNSLLLNIGKIYTEKEEEFKAKNSLNGCVFLSCANGAKYIEDVPAKLRLAFDPNVSINQIDQIYIDFDIDYTDLINVTGFSDKVDKAFEKLLICINFYEKSKKP